MPMINSLRRSVMKTTPLNRDRFPIGLLSHQDPTLGRTKLTQLKKLVKLLRIFQRMVIDLEIILEIKMEIKLQKESRVERARDHGSQENLQTNK